MSKWPITWNYWLTCAILYRRLDEDKIEEEVSALRTKLLANLAAMATDVRSLKPSDRHGLAAAKKEELSKMARALGTRQDYHEGDAFDREKQEEQRMRRMAEREERERQREEERAKMQAQKEKWEAEKRERERLRQPGGSCLGLSARVKPRADF